MVALNRVRASNARIKSFNSGLVAVFVGGTSGIGESTMKQFCVFAVKPTIYIIGRNQVAGERVVTELQDIDRDGIYNFIKKDVSLLEDVDEVCTEIQEKEQKINLLFMTCGSLSMKGRNETSEGIDMKLATNYYSRMRFVYQLIPGLRAARPGLARVISVLFPGEEKVSFNHSDPGLIHNFSLANATNHAAVMTNFFFEEAAKIHPSVSFVHSYPGVVKTGFLKDMNPAARAVAQTVASLWTLWTVSIGESGERHLYLATNGRYPPADKVTVMPVTENEGGCVRPISGEGGRGVYTVGKDCEYRVNEAVIDHLRLRGTGNLVHRHTLAEFDRVRDRVLQEIIDSRV